MKIDRDLLAACVERAGFMKGARIAEFIVAWGIAEAELGHEIGIEEFGAWWREKDLRTAYRRLAEMRAAFPEAVSPHDLVDVQTHRPERRRAAVGRSGALPGQ